MHARPLSSNPDGATHAEPFFTPEGMAGELDGAGVTPLVPPVPDASPTTPHKLGEAAKTGLTMMEVAV